MKNNIATKREISFLPPEGNHRCTVIDTFKLEDEEKGLMDRILVHVEVPDNQEIEFRAGRNFQSRLAEGSGLHWFLKIWLGEQKLKRLMDSGGDLRQLIGQRGIVQIEHRYTDRPLPFANIASIRPLNADSDSVTVNLPLPKPLITTTDTRTTNQSGATTLADHGTLTANASICTYCGSEIGRFSKVQ